MAYAVRMVLLFFAYSFAGWCIEVTLKWIQFHRFINRGFLTGPVCPIYGAGAVLITACAEQLAPVESAVGTTFALSFVLCGALEYLTSWFMEKRFHARWWDYSKKPMNLNGRVWIGNLALFGLGGTAVVHLFDPLLDRVIGALPPRAAQIAAIFLLAVFAADYALTHFILRLVKLAVENSRADSTEEIGREIRMLLEDRSVFTRRFADAYPEVIYRTERIRARIEAVRAETERLRREAERRIGEGAQRAAKSLEPSAVIRSGIIARQDELIGMLYDEGTATDEMKRLKRGIEAERRRLAARPLSQIVDGMAAPAGRKKA